MKTRLDITGLYHFWQKILNQLQDKKTIQTAVTDPTASGVAIAFIDSISQNTQGVIVPTKKTVPNASQSSAGLMSVEDKVKLDAVEPGAQVNTVTGVKGDAEASYRQGNVNLTPANLGAVAKAGDTMTGVLDVPAIELGLSIPGIGGGYIDFHYNGSNNDYTSRIMETASGHLDISGSIGLGSPLGLTSGGTGGTTKQSAREGIGIRYVNIAITTSPTVTDIGGNYQVVNVFPFSPDPEITFSALLINGLWQIYCNKPGNGLVVNILYFEI